MVIEGKPVTTMMLATSLTSATAVTLAKAVTPTIAMMPEAADTPEAGNEFRGYSQIIRENGKYSFHFYSI
jgi:hypothetical protein